MNNQKPGLISDTKKSAKTLAQQVAKQIAREPLEILKGAGRQVLATPEAPSQAPRQQTQQSIGSPDMSAHAEKVKKQDTRLLSALEQEIKEISMRRDQKEQQIKMAEHEQKQQAAQVGKESPPMVSSKRSRRMGAQPQSQKATVERQQKHVESPVQSST